jgi:hypothetical protein
MNLHSDVAPSEDLPHEPQAMAHWSESYAFWAWDKRNSLTIYGHFQRHPDKPIIWRGYCTVMRGDQIYAIHTYGRQRSPFGPGFESVHVTIEEPHHLWRFRAEGAGQQRSCASLFKSAINDGPAVPLKVDVQLTCRTPVWALKHGTPGTEAIMPAHYEQTGKVIGFVEIGDKRYEVDCLGANDHSHGPRNTQTLYNGSGFFNAAFPSGRSLTAIQMSPTAHTGYINCGDGEIRTVTRVVMPKSGWEPGETGSFTAETDDRSVEVSYEITPRRVALTMVPPNYEHIGLIEGPATRLVYCDLTCNVQWDGEHGSGSWEPCWNNDAPRASSDI